MESYWFPRRTCFSLDRMATEVNLRLLRTLLAVVEKGSVNAAACALGFVPSAVSQQIARLEHQVGAELFSRRPGGALAVTMAGRRIAAAAEEVLGAAAEFQHAVETIAEGRTLAYPIGAFPSVGSEVLPLALSQLKAEHGDITVALNEMDPDEGVRALRGGVIDSLIAYRYFPDDAPSYEGLVVEHIYREPLLLCCSPLTASGEQQSTGLAHCQSQPWVSGHPGRPDRRILDWWTRHIGIVARVQHETDDHSTALSLIASGLAVGLLPASIVYGWNDARRPIAVVVNVPMEDSAYRDVLLVHRPRYTSPIPKKLTAFLTDLFARYPIPADATYFPVDGRQPEASDSGNLQG